MVSDCFRGAAVCRAEFVRARVPSCASGRRGRQGARCWRCPRRGPPRASRGAAMRPAPLIRATHSSVSARVERNGRSSKLLRIASLPSGCSHQRSANLEGHAMQLPIALAGFHLLGCPPSAARIELAGAKGVPGVCCRNADCRRLAQPSKSGDCPAAQADLRSQNRTPDRRRGPDSPHEWSGFARLSPVRARLRPSAHLLPARPKPCPN